MSRTPTFTEKSIAFAGAAWRWLRTPFFVLFGLAVGFGVPYAIFLDRLVSQRFAELTFTQPSRVYARPLWLAPNVRMTPEALDIELSASRYREVKVAKGGAAATQPGTYSKQGATYTIATREFRGALGLVPAQRLSVTLKDGRVSALSAVGSKAKLDDAQVDPARIATLYGPKQEERRIVRARDVPPLLIGALQAVEDRDFKHHMGVNPMAIIRAAWVNMRSGEVVQGGSTLTQQLVRNLFLSRQQTLWRKANEAALAMLIEARYSKDRILEAYLNEVYLGQQGAQAVHGVAAASEFYFGRELDALGAHEIALLIGMIQGPSLHDPRRFPDRALQRRNLVLRVMEETGLLTAADRAVATRQPLNVLPQGALPRNRYPAFVELVRAQIASNFPDAALGSEGLQVLSTLAPSTQRFAEIAVAERLAALGEKGKKLEAAVVVANSKSGSVEAVVGGRNADKPGFNRALKANRPIGSLVKPFVYLVALAQPNKFSLMTPLEDRAISMKQPNGTVWQPMNSDKKEHGTVALVDALARSYNLATVRLGLAVEVDKVARVMDALIPGASVNPNPSMLLGAVDLSPFQVAQAYQYLASDGHPQPLAAVEAVLDSRGRPLTRYIKTPAPGELVAPARLVTYALQETAKSGTARELQTLGLAGLKAAGKTGTSNDQRDSWYAGYTGSHLAIVWVGADDNTDTGLYGATGALRIWASLFKRLPSDPLALPLGENPRMVVVSTSLQRSVDSYCEGARSLPFIKGYEPVGAEECGYYLSSEPFDREGWERYGEGGAVDGRTSNERGRGYDTPPRSANRAEEPRRRSWRDWFRRDDDRRDARRRESEARRIEAEQRAEARRRQDEERELERRSREDERRYGRDDSRDDERYEDRGGDPRYADDPADLDGGIEFEDNEDFDARDIRDDEDRSRYDDERDDYR